MLFKEAFQGYAFITNGHYLLVITLHFVDDVISG